MVGRLAPLLSAILAALVLNCGADTPAPGASDKPSGGDNGGPSEVDKSSTDGTSGGPTDPPPPPATHADGTKNLGETDVDCGGAESDPSGAAKRCEVGQGCKAASDCTSNACRYDGKCVDAREKSCVNHHGGDTCGPAANQESCCKSIPAGGAAVDKYVITAGRFRAFVDAVGGDIRGFVKTAKPAGWDPSWDVLVPKQLNDGEYVSHEGVYQELGPGLHFGAAGGNQGCAVEQYGARTYFVPPDVSTTLWGETNHYTQNDLDEKVLNCVSFYMMAAFCAWDGGHLATEAEFNAAWGPTTYPWGTTPRPQGWNISWGSAAEAAEFGSPAGSGSPDVANYAYNWWSPATRVCDGDSWCDYSVHLSPPGRFPAGNGPAGHADLAGLVFNVTSTWNGPRVKWSKSGSWQGHGIPYGDNDGFNPLSKYWATGGRCAH